MPLRKINYKSSGVDIKKAGEFIDRLKLLSLKTARAGAVGRLGGFGGLFEPRLNGYKKPVLVSSTDGVGTKLKLALLLNRHNTVGIDLVAMNVNDILCCGAEPLFFLDYIACGKLDTDVLTEVVKGIVKGCKEAGCALIGGETAQMSGMYKDGDYDLAGFCVGIVEKNDIINGKKIAVGDKIIGVESSGLHSNGFSLVRKALSRSDIIKHSDELLKPTRIYVKPVLSLLITHNSKLKTSIKGIAHITGGAFYSKLARILPRGKAMKIKKNSWRIPGIFRFIQKRGNIDDKEMFGTFNMGVGMALVVDKSSQEDIIAALSRHNLNSWVIGEVIKGNGEIVIR